MLGLTECVVEKQEGLKGERRISETGNRSRDGNPSRARRIDRVRVAFVVVAGQTDTNRLVMMYVLL